MTSPFPTASADSRARDRERAFTLVEILVVIAILVALAGLLVPTISTAHRRSKAMHAKNDITALAQAANSWKTNAGSYPPTTFEEEFDVSTNGICDGIESLLAHITSQNHGGPYFEFDDAKLSNLDKDSNETLQSKLNWIFGDSEMREYIDPFGNPYVYVENSGYKETYKSYHNGGSDITTVTASRSEKSKTYFEPTSFQIWSCGMNGVNDNGKADGDEADDIGSWQ